MTLTHPVLAAWAGQAPAVRRESRAAPTRRRTGRDARSTGQRERPAARPGPGRTSPADRHPAPVTGSSSPRRRHAHADPPAATPHPLAARDPRRPDACARPPVPAAATPRQPGLPPRPPRWPTDHHRRTGPPARPPAAHSPGHAARSQRHASAQACGRLRRTASPRGTCGAGRAPAPPARRPGPPPRDREPPP